MTSQGSAYGRFQRALARRSLFHAELAARELGWLSLADALKLTALIAESEAARFERAAVRWHGRFELEAKGLTIADSQFALSALAGLVGPSAHVGLETLERLTRLYGISGAENSIRRSG